MTRYIPLTILALSLVSGLAQAKDHKEKHKSLPPGLQKKVANGGELPPGWQKKLRRGDILSRDIYDRGRIIQPISDDGIIGIQVDDTIIRVINNTREIVDILSRKH
ncbi:hypothetical protein AAEU32_13740 [Pseudoalteromonas sp. SSDWG2]|uniref:hypothetical protein n=1 Tax=Pseudoalteromonas sp. SSDWG2 TaxID=3139391 RepID=UPI003BA861FD